MALGGGIHVRLFGEAEVIVDVLPVKRIVDDFESTGENVVHWLVALSFPAVVL